jgi:hypothetical protein
MMHAKMGASKMGTVKTAKPSMGSASKRADGVAVRGKTNAHGNERRQEDSRFRS